MDNNDVVIIELDRARELRLTHKVLKKITARTKKKLSELGDALDDYGILSIVMFEMLKRDDPSITEEKVDELLDAVPLHIVFEKCSEAITASLGGDNEAAAAAAAPEGKTGDPT